jgi:Gpi18-like mannosyltransferase
MIPVQERAPERTRTLPTWAVLLIGYAASRVITTALLLTFWAASNHWSIAHFDGGPGFGGFLTSWDGLYYDKVAEHGYPLTLPHDIDGNIAKNAWAFLPVYPLLVRAVMIVTGLGFPIAGPVVSAVAGGAATFAVHAVIAKRFNEKTALWGALFFCFGPLSYVLQVAYAESVFLFLMFAALAAMMSRRYLVMLPFALLACFAHPGGIVLAAALALQRLRIGARRQPSTARARATAWTTVALVGLAGIAWPFVAGLATGNPSAYFETETAWWRDYIGQIHFFPFTPWFVFAGHYWGAVGILLVLAVLAGFVVWFTRPSARRLGSDIRGYTLAWVAYLVAVFLPQQSLFRMLLPLSPLLGHPALSRTRRRQRVTLAVCLALQPVGILLFWVIWPP